MKGLFVLLFYIICCDSVISSVVKLENNAYKGIVVAIDDVIPKEKKYKIKTAIKDMFTSGSAFLYNATNKRAYFGEVTILFPKSWGKTSEEEYAGTESFISADIRISTPNLQRFNNMSYTMYQEECGKEAKFIHINEGHLLNAEPLTITRTLYGDPGRWLTKHWAMYRYGIYEEHGLIGNDNFRTFYGVGDSYEFTNCGNRKRFSYGQEYDFLTGSNNCKLISDIPYKYCYYSSFDINLESSITYDHVNQNVQKFCGDGEKHFHKSDQRTPHNSFCKGQSTWDVIMQHEDFKNDNNPPQDVNRTVLRPTFRFVIPRSNKRFVVVIDISASMNGTHLKMLNSALEQAVINHLPLKSAFGIVGFNEKSKVLYKMKTVNEYYDKHSIISAFPKVGEGSTCIACGLEKALEMIKEFDPESCLGTNIILLTDGNENEQIRIKDVLHKLKNESIRIFPIAYGNYADAHLELLSKETNGNTYFIPKINTTSSDDFYNCISPIITEDDPSAANVICNLNNRNASLTFQKETAVPKTDVMGSSLLFQYILFPENIKTVKVEGWINVDGKQINATTQRVSIYAFIHNKKNIDKKFKIFAEISLPNGTKTQIQLHDNGIQPDMFKGDNVYARYFLNFIGNGRYDVKLLVYGAIKPSSIFVDRRFIARTKVMDMKTYISIGSFKVTDRFHSTKNDIYPPNAIEDLRVVKFDNITYQITLNWTAPGNDFDIGQASRYELKYSDEYVNLGIYFDTYSDVIKQTHLKFGSLTPSPSGHKEKITWQIPDHIINNKTYYSIHFAIRAIDASNNYAKVSNVVTARIKHLKPKIALCQQTGTMFAHPTDCKRYFICENNYGFPTEMKCPLSTKFDYINKICDWKQDGEC